MISERFWSKVQKGGDCWKWTGCCSRGPSRYGTFKVRGRHEYAHRVAWQFARGEIPPGMKVLHRCDEPLCVRVEHLFLGTQADNVRDMHIKGRARKSRGERHHKAKFTDEQIEEIRRLRAQGVAPIELRRRFGVSEGYVWKLVNYYSPYRLGLPVRSPEDVTKDADPRGVNAPPFRKLRGPLVKLSNSQVAEARALHEGGMLAAEIALRFGVSRQRIWQIAVRGDRPTSKA